MGPTQQRFWPDAQPLVERLGREFFRKLPEAPGVYQMRGATGAVLYVGKAKNLRHRLCSYRVANPERMARRTLRLLNLVVDISLEECPDETSALRREAELLLEIKPRFNRAGVWQGARRSIGWRCQDTGLELAVLDAAETGWNCIGSFGAQAKYLHQALVRLLWCRLHPVGLAGMPAGWVHGRHGSRVLIPHADRQLIADTGERLLSLTRGENENFQQWLGMAAFSFEQPVRDEDLELITKHMTGRVLQLSEENRSRLSVSSGQI